MLRVHPNARTTPVARAEIAHSTEQGGVAVPACAPGNLCRRAGRRASRD